MLEVDAAAAKVVIAELAKVLGLKIGTDNLDTIIKKTDEIMRQLSQGNAVSQCRWVCSQQRVLRPTGPGPTAIIHTLR